MRTGRTLGLCIALLWACGGRSGLGLFDERRIATAESGGRDASSSTLGGGGFGGSARGGAPAVSAGGFGTGALTASEVSGWQVVEYNPAMGAPAPPAKEFNSVWADGAERVWFIEEPLGDPKSRRLLTWQSGVVSTELTDCGPAWTIRGGAINDLWLAGCTAGLMHKGTAWASDTRRHGNWVWENTPQDLWSCCETTDSNSTYSAFNWNGSSWTSVPLPSADYKGGALWSAGPHDLWIADRDLLHWDGSAWRTFNNPYIVGWRDVWGDGTNVWAVGANTTVARWNGRDFETLTTQPNGELEGVWGRPNDVWFVGMFGAILHWDGAKISAVPSPVVANLLSVWGAEDVLWVTGSQETLIKRKLEGPP